ncbi:hypothetical protein [Acetonema longum]|uniref:Uncharacterized protein n=1 Tax=Acetonema longum DSM 6540 TaxID=1009370 RepID=F7NK37_9FIRM|nr:hypothetical protein [Acetonema longum]EGO63478.1 hypothetical protein ALO_12251 [Acetonema longum DSM 6540]
MTQQEAQEAIEKMKRGPRAREYTREIDRLTAEHGFLTPLFLHHFSQWHQKQTANAALEQLKAGAPGRSQDDAVKILARYIRNCLDDDEK